MIRFIHCADIHLGRSIRSHMDMPDDFVEAVQQATYLSFQRIIDKAIELNVDFVLVCGDLFDNEHRSLRAQWFVKKQAVRLAERNIPLYLIHGNHDPLIKMKLPISMPENVHVFPESVQAIKRKFREEEVYIYGFSYPERAYKDNPIPPYKKEGDDKAYHIGMLHGQERMQQDHDPYAPFSLGELKEKGFDYWALGHIHKRQILSEKPPIVYPGNVQGGHRKETGSKGAYYVELTKTDTNMMFIGTAPVEWLKIQAKIDGLDSMEMFMEHIEEEIKNEISGNQYFIDLEVIGKGVLHDQLIDYKDQQEFISLLRDELSISVRNVWIEKIHFKTMPFIDRKELSNQEHLMGDVVRIVDSLKMEKTDEAALRPVFSHPILKQFLDQLSEVDRQEILDQAENLLLTSLMDNEVRR
ncbi:metallophosphoesterase family protein [Litchfieldia alkalitelluris]|uniref:metallophosphoesterase family protein n=1 Tax=Litchfieldia alkalitelluris TaxID=304268 RepID=UPI001594CFD6|nr:DNA repair exonuclease [Litchfieldia alkalitelluris]